jgi:branched-chain amino acid transport system permease protein
MAPSAGSIALRRYRLRAADILWAVLAIAAFFLFPNRLSFGSIIIVAVIFAISVDIVVGFPRIISLGQALYFGLGAYAAGLIAASGWTEPITGALLSAIVSALVALCLGPLILRLRELPLIMVTIAVAQLVYEAAHKNSWLTGGDDGLYGFQVGKLFGIFGWSLYGSTAYLYALGWAIVIFVLARVVTSSPFGVCLQGIRENADRMRLLGTPVLLRQVQAYVLGAAIAGLGGAVLAQSQSLVSLYVLSLDQTIDGLVLLALGGVGSIYGAILGAPVYMIIKYVSQLVSPQYWLFSVGLLLIAVVTSGKNGLIGIWEDVLDKVRSRKT